MGVEKNMEMDKYFKVSYPVFKYYVYSLKFNETF